MMATMGTAPTDVPEATADSPVHAINKFRLAARGGDQELGLDSPIVGFILGKNVRGKSMESTKR